MKHNDIQLVKKIIAECNDIIRYTSKIDEKMFLENDIYQKATAMSLLNIGEHANSLTREIWDDYQEIEWRKIVELRNIVAHGYGELDMEIIWNLSKNDVPLLLGQFKKLIA